MKKVIGYVRVSRDRDGEKLSPEIQREAIEKFCISNQLALIGIVEDLDIKGSSFNRPGWNDLLKRLPAAHGVVFYSLDRFGRNLEESLRWGRYLQEQGKEILSVNESVDLESMGGRIHYKTLLFLSDLFLEMHSQKMKDVQAHKLEAGEWRGGPLPLGYAYEDSKVVIDEKEASIVRDIFERRRNGESINNISEAYRNTPGKRGGRISEASVVKILSNTHYISKRVKGGETYSVNIPTIISDDMWNAVQSKKRTRPKNDTYLLSGKLTCGKCGAVMYRQKKYGRDEGKADWVCSNQLTKHSCPGLAIRETKAEVIVSDEFSNKFNGLWDSWDLEEKRNGIDLLIESIIVRPTGERPRLVVNWR